MPAQNEYPVSFLVVVGNSTSILSRIVLTDSSFSFLSGKFHIGFIRRAQNHILGKDKL